ncbi:unnamed protein product [Paramecium sonneborni]|uniref:Uncharacterized protein n=1 Tax=Paramecium sonneborni TaxID=65129 RepID=A0A8S1QVH8_9CILI|nr:unnamed protein product [Paramecium sonneborni]
MNYQNSIQRTPKALQIQIPSSPPILRTQLSPNQFSSPKRIIPVTEIIRIIPNDLPSTPQLNPLQKPDITVPELKNFLDDLLKRYDKLVIDLQNSTQNQIKLQNELTNLQKDANYKIQATNIENSILSETLKNKNEEITLLHQLIDRLKQQHLQEIQDLKQENQNVSAILTNKLQQMNSFAKDKLSELEQTKSLLQLRDQEVLEWRSRKNNPDTNTQESNNMKSNIPNFNQTYDQIINENQNLKSQLQQKQNEINVLKNQLQQGLSKNDLQLYAELQQARKEIQYYQEQIMSKQSNDNLADIEDHEEKIQILESEIKRLNKQLADMRHELENYRAHQSENEFLKSKLSDKQNQIKDQRIRNVQN